MTSWIILRVLLFWRLIFQVILLFWFDVNDNFPLELFPSFCCYLKCVVLFKDLVLFLCFVFPSFGDVSDF